MLATAQHKAMYVYTRLSIFQAERHSCMMILYSLLFYNCKTFWNNTVGGGGSVSVVSLRHVEFGFGGEVGEVVTARYGGGTFLGILVGKGLSQTLYNK